MQRILSFGYGRVCLLALFILAGCTKPEVNQAEYSEEFKPIFETVTKLYDQNRPAEAIRHLDSGFHKIANPTINDYFRYYSFNYVDAKKIKHDYFKGLLYADTMFMYAKKSVNEKQYAANFSEANYAKGDAFFALKKYTEAYQYYYQGYLLGKNYLNKAALADFTYRMGMIMYKQGHFKHAVKYFKESYGQTPFNKTDFAAFYRRQEILDNIGLSYKKLGKDDSAMVYFDKTLAYIDSNTAAYKNRDNVLQMARGVVYGNKAEVLMNRRQYTAAEKMLKKSIAINLQKGNDYSDAQLSEIKLGRLYLTRNELAPLKDLLDLMAIQFDTVKNEIAEADWAALQAEYHIKNKEFEKAVEYLQLHNLRKDSINTRLSSLKETDVTQQVTNYENQRKIDTLRNNNQLQKIYLVLALVCAILLTLIIFLIQRNWKRSRKEVLTVNKLNKQINEQNTVLENALTELNLSSREKDRILRTVAHDLRNPLGGIASLSSVMMDDEDYTADQKELINLIKETSNNSLELINEILEATNSGTAKFVTEPVEINSLLSNSVELLRFKAAEKNQNIQLELLDHTKELNISREKIWRVISNLISNASKFSPFGGTINVKITDEGDEVKIAVNDHGIGIPDNIKNEVFNMFTDAKRPGTAGEKSFGLGLSICKQIIERHKGKIWFESIAGTGTTFYIKLNAA
ncbi:tetratricopeptide repeat-containing sensor histidine kinase [Mucilaginibacter hurinus]|uniref:tetratricopeptide repeat-containing sensor histidine kinase n=1 Tax=Mucilaginibacter hurinus TaxID=2201324 RepID=UPI0011BE9336|nr:HAMP domain-containing sensor histidine kinase [Mucilaginibacter hurinus]